MKVALVHEWLTTYSGSEKVLKALSEIYPKAPIFVPIYNKTKVSAFSDKIVHTSFLQNLPKAQSKPQIYLPWMLKAFESFDFSDFDVVISSSHAFAKGIKTSPKTLHICYCHYPLRYVWEPSVDPRLSTNPIYRILRELLKKPDLVAAGRPDIYVANSKNTAAKIKKHYGREATVIYPPVDISQFGPTRSPSKDYFLIAGRLISYKNPMLVIKAFNRLNLKLKVVGAGPEKARLEQTAKGNIEFLGRVTDTKLAKLYANCRALIFPGEEDFGIVPVEVLASGRPVIAHDRGGVREVVRRGIDGAFFDSPTEKAVIATVNKFDADMYKTENLVSQAQRFSTSRFKSEIKHFIQEQYNRIKN
jgi:glycosyltransferase involved in cell wall biosynthesis